VGSGSTFTLRLPALISPDHPASNNDQEVAS